MLVWSPTNTVFSPPGSYGLGPKRSLALAAFLKTFCAAEIRSLNIEGCGVPESAMAAVIKALKEGGRGLTSLNISANQIRRESTAKLISGTYNTRHTKSQFSAILCGNCV